MLVNLMLKKYEKNIFMALYIYQKYIQYHNIGKFNNTNNLK